MPREAFEREIRQLHDELLVLGSMVERALPEAVRALKYRDHRRSRRLIDDDRIINEKRYAIEAETLALIATQQPMASDLRVIIAILNITTEIERIGDYAVGIARVSLRRAWPNLSSQVVRCCPPSLVAAILDRSSFMSVP